MSLSGISFSGLASGLDSKAIINALMAVERRPILALRSKKILLNKSKSLFNDFKAMIEALQSKAKAIKDIDAFLKFTATTDDEDKYFSVSANEKASPGSYTIDVDSLAKATTKVSTGTADKDTTFVTDATPFTFTFGDSSTLTVSPSSSLTLQGLADQINNAESSPGVTQTKVRATVLDTGTTGATRYKLVITSLKEGTDAGFTVAGDIGASQTESFFTAMSNNNSENTDAQDSQIKVNGVTVTRSSNTISDAIEGVTFTLKGEHPNGPPTTTKVTVTTDTTATAEKVKEFVDAYNAVVDFVKKQNELNEDGGAKGPLFGDVTLRQVRHTLRGLVGASVATGNAKYSLLSQAGIKSDTDGKLTFSASDFGDALADDPTAIKKLFSDAANGITGKVFTKIEGLTDSIDGLFKARIDGFDRQIRDADRSITNKERLLEAFEERQIKKFAALESLIAQLQAQGGALASFSLLSTS